MTMDWMIAPPSDDDEINPRELEYSYVPFNKKRHHEGANLEGPSKYGWGNDAPFEDSPNFNVGESVTADTLGDVISYSVNKALKEEILAESTPACVIVTGKSCVGGGNMVNTDVTKCATLDGTPVTIQDMHKIVTFSNNPNPYRIAGIQANPNGNGSDDLTSSNDPCGCNLSGDFPGSFDFTNWVDSWTNNGAFTNAVNPNQPCNHICQRKQLWTSQLANAGPLWANMLYCKLQAAQQQIQIHGCNC